jgi:hypothetical protein
LLLASTGPAAKHINGQTAHTGLGIPKTFKPNYHINHS